jgi:hypothetical protein
VTLSTAEGICSLSLHRREKRESDNYTKNLLRSDKQISRRCVGAQKGNLIQTWASWKKFLDKVMLDWNTKG